MSARGESLVAELQSRLDAIHKGVLRTERRPKVACIEWLDPLMTAGNWVPELVEVGGGENLLGRAGEHSPWLKWDALAEADPEVVVVLPCGFDLGRTRAEAKVLSENAHWKKLRAVQEGAVFLTDGHNFFNRPGPRLVESAEILAEILHPEIFPATSDRWVRM